MQPTDPQNDIMGTGNCELWNSQVDLTRPPPVQETAHDSEQYLTPSQPPQAEDWLPKFTLPKFHIPEMTCGYGIDRKWAPSPLSASAFHRMHKSLLVIEAYMPCGIPLSKTLQQKSKDYFIDSHDFQLQATIPRLNAHTTRLCPPIT
jgi:hypothetical protein